MMCRGNAAPACVRTGATTEISVGQLFCILLLSVWVPAFAPVLVWLHASTCSANRDMGVAVYKHQQGEDWETGMPGYCACAPKKPHSLGVDAQTMNLQEGVDTSLNGRCLGTGHSSPKSPKTSKTRGGHTREQAIGPRDSPKTNNQQGAHPQRLSIAHVMMSKHIRWLPWSHKKKEKTVE